MFLLACMSGLIQPVHERMCVSGPFTIYVDTSMILDGGPQTIKVFIGNTGKTAVVVEKQVGSSSLSVYDEDPSHIFGSITTGGWQAGGEVQKQHLELKPGEFFTESEHLHLYLLPPKSGSHLHVCSEVRYRLKAEQNGDIKIAIPEVPFQYSPRKPSPSDLVRIRAEIERDLLRSDRSPESISKLIDRFRGTRVPALVPLDLLFLDHVGIDGSNSDEARLLSNLERRAPDEATRLNLVMDELQKPCLASARLFVYWANGEKLLPKPTSFDKLLAAPNLWVRALTVAAFPEHVTKQQADAIRDQIRKHLRPQSSDEFQSLLAAFESPRFETRKIATKKMAATGEPVEAMVLAALANAPTAEAEHRLRRVLIDMGIVDPLPESLRAIRALKRMKTSQARDLLKVIGEGPAGLRSTREAKKGN